MGGEGLRAGLLEGFGGWRQVIGGVGELGRVSQSHRGVGARGLDAGRLHRWVPLFP